LFLTIRICSAGCGIDEFSLRGGRNPFRHGRIVRHQRDDHEQNDAMGCEDDPGPVVGPACIVFVVVLLHRCLLISGIAPR
jgi:hypothetical protein